MAKGRAVPPRPIVEYKPAPALNECNCDSCLRIDGILQRERARLEARAATGYRKAGRGVVEVHICVGCGEHLADGGQKDGIEYTAQRELTKWDADNGALIANYNPDAEYIVVVLDPFTDTMTTRQLAYATVTPSA